jgi:hypothetical protein
MSQFKKYQNDFEIVNDLTGLRRYLADWHEHEYLALEQCPGCQTNESLCTFRYYQGKSAFKRTCESCAGRTNSGCNTKPCSPWPTRMILSASCINCIQGSCLSQLPIKAQSLEDISWNDSCDQCSNDKRLTCVFPPAPSKQRENPVDYFESWLLGSNLFRHNRANVYYCTSSIDDLEEQPDGIDPEEAGASHQDSASIDASSGPNESTVRIDAPSALDASMAETSLATDYDVEMRNMEILTAWAQSGDSGVLDYLKPPW